MVAAARRVSDSAEQKWSSRLLLHPLALSFCHLALPAPAHGVRPLTRVPASLVSGTKTVVDISDGAGEPGLASPASYMNPFPVLHLVEDLRLALETLERPQERAALLSQIPGPTATYIKEWFEESAVSRPVPVGEPQSRSPSATAARGCDFTRAPSSLFLLPVQP